MAQVILLLVVALLPILRSIAAVKCPIGVNTDISGNAAWVVSATSPEVPSCVTMGIKASVVGGAMEVTTVSRAPGTTNCADQCSEAQKTISAQVQTGGLSTSTSLFYFRCYDNQAAVDGQPPPGKIDPSKKDINCTPNSSSIKQVSWMMFVLALFLSTLLLR